MNPVRHLTAVFLLAASTLGAQESSLAIGAHAIGLVTHETNTPQARALTEGCLTQPMVTAIYGRDWLESLATVDLEGLTLRRGELDQGAWGEGYVDRRHPHTYLHELVAGAAMTTGAVRLSLVGGRGFAPFGSDDPMTRPFVSYPVDHHLAQILERIVVIGALRGGPLTLEGATFNGDEPLSPSSMPELRRFGDSWSVRATLDGSSIPLLSEGMELSASYASVKSPEYVAGAGLDQRKAHASVRFARAGSVVTRYALVEVARTTDVDRGRPLYAFDALLAEGAMCGGRAGLGVRVERSDRPEEERLLDPFRSARPATDLSILGVTQWTTITAAVTLPFWTATGTGARVDPFIEAARIIANRTSAALFDPVRFYGSNRMWRLSAGLRLGLGHEHGRMGRYGVASEVTNERRGMHHHTPSNFQCLS